MLALKTKEIKRKSLRTKTRTKIITKAAKRIKTKINRTRINLYLCPPLCTPTHVYHRSQAQCKIGSNPKRLKTLAISRPREWQVLTKISIQVQQPPSKAIKSTRKNDPKSTTKRAVVSHLRTRMEVTKKQSKNSNLPNSRRSHLLQLQTHTITSHRTS